jgi:outer membrane protein
MKIVRPIVCFCLTLSLAIAAFAADEVKLGAVDFRKVGQQSEAGKKAASSMKEMKEKYQSAINAKGKELDALKKAYDEKGKKLPEAKRDAKEKELQRKFQEYRQYGENAEREMQKKDEEFTKQIVGELEKIVKEYGLKNGYAAIVSKDGLIYNDARYEVKDLTDEILKLFNATGKK